jgi:tagaturonate reductase
MQKRVLQFGTSRFLQAHADLFVHHARCEGQNIGPITIVKTTMDHERDHRVDALNMAIGFPVRLKGFEKGQLVDELITVKSVVAAFSAYDNWQKLLQIFSHETEIVISNVGDAGYKISADDEQRTSAVPSGYIAKLLNLLLHRFENGAKPLLILPCELISNNGQALRQLLMSLCATWRVDDAFVAWLTKFVMICDTLVDRIVSEAIEPIGAVAEPYGLWAIQREPDFVAPFTDPHIVYTDNLEPYLRLKLHVLNLGHTFLAQIWKIEQRSPHETVREILKDASVKDRLIQLYVTEIIPGFSAHEMEGAARDYVRNTMERFENPFLDHHISDIFGNHEIKIERRAVDFIGWVKLKAPALEFPLLNALSNSPAPYTALGR